MKRIERWASAVARTALIGLAAAAVAAETNPPLGELVPFFDAYETNAFQPNALYLHSLPGKAWWNPLADARIPILLTEPVGLDRQEEPVSVFHTFPAGTSPRSIHVVTPAGREIASQVRVIDVQSNLMEVLFLFTLKGGGQEPLFLYYGATDVASPEPPAEPPILSLRDSGRFFTVANSRFAVQLNKVAGSDGLAVVRGIMPHGAAYPQMGGIRRDAVPAGTPATVIEDGPLRKTVAYTWTGGVFAVFSVVGPGPLLYFQRQGRLSTSDTWLPGGDTVNDALYYESVEGVRSFPIGYSGGNTQPAKYALTPFLKESWLAIRDQARGEILGAMFDGPLYRRIDLQTLAEGYLVALSCGTNPHGAIYCDRGSDIGAFRKAYIAWKNPLLVTLGAAQPRTTTKPAVPVLGNDFLLMHLLRGRYWNRNDETTARRWVQAVKEFGGNYGMHWASNLQLPESAASNTPSMLFLEEIVAAAHAEGIGVAHGHIHLNTNLAHGLAERGLDAVWLSDEWAWGAQSLKESEKQEFTRLYGMDPPADCRTTNLTDTAQYNLFRYRMEVNQRIHAEAADAARKISPGMLITQTTSPNNFRIREFSSPQDVERLADIQTTLCTDLYSLRTDFLASMIKYMRGSMGNRKPMLIISGYCGWDARPPVELNQYLQILFGANALAYFILDRPCNPAPALGARDAYLFVDYTGLGSLMAKCRPLPFAAVFRDRDEYFASLRRGEYQMMGNGDYAARIGNFIQAMGNVPNDIVCSKYFTPELLAPYKLLIIPSNLSISAATAAVIERYVADGGCVILEADDIRQPALSALAGVTPGGAKTSGKLAVKGLAPPYEGMETELGSKRTPVTANPDAQVLAAFSDGAPAITLATRGKGKVAYMAMDLAARLGIQDQPAGWVRPLVRHMTGSPPVEVAPAEAEKGLLVNAFTDGARHVIGIYNESGKPKKDFTLRLAGFPPSCNALLSYRTGRVVELREGVSGFLSLRTDEVDFYLLGERGALPAPTAATQVRPSVSQAARTGMAFLKQEIQPTRSDAIGNRKKDPDAIYVGLFRNAKPAKRAVEMGGEAMLAAAVRLPKVVAEYLPDLEPGTLAFYDVIIVPNLHDSTPIAPGWEATVRRFVENGGGALLVHHAVGFGESSKTAALFPEIGRGTGTEKVTRFQVAGSHPVTSAAAFRKRFRQDLENPAFAHVYQEPVMEKGDVIESGFPDHVVMEKGTAGEIVALSAAEDDRGNVPSILAGSVGKGRVVLSGMDLGCREVTADGKKIYEETLSDGERKILNNAIFWLGERTPE